MYINQDQIHDYLMTQCWHIKCITLIVSSFVLCLVAQSCLTLCEPNDYSMPGSLGLEIAQLEFHHLH